jgi:GMP synthase (glutamine-hydrolyzing), N-terminal domain or A subunit
VKQQSPNIHSHKILILDFGSQYTQLIARRIREIGVYCEIYSCECSAEQIETFSPNGIILSGGPETVTSGDTPRAPACIFELNVPVLGICYGLQTMTEQLGGKVESSDHREFGYAQIRARGHSKLLTGIEDHLSAEGFGLLDVWMSHGDRVVDLPSGFTLIASSEGAPIAGIANEDKGFYGLQFHPEVTHTKQGGRILSRFVLEICGCEALWTSSNIIEDSIEVVRKTVGNDHVV